jgi:cytochrome c553
MEGDAATGSPTAFHKNGRIELRDPDTGLTIKGVTHSGTTSAPGAYTSTGTDATPVRFSRNLGSATLEADTQAIMVNQCLKCHDAGGAASATAIVPGGTAGRPFAGTITANPGQNVLDVAAQFAGGNRAFHPILVRNNAPYTNSGGTRMAAPWNSGPAKTGTSTVYGPLMTCWDCHAPNGASGTLTTSGIHGGTPNSTDAVPLRGNVFVNSATATTGALNLCINCHVVTGNTTNHGTGSGITSGTNNSMTYFSNRCYYCHSTANSTAKPARPIPSGDVHGYTAMDFAGTAFPAANRGYVFFRRAGLPVAVRVGGTGTATCGNGTGICSNTMGTYTPGGAY